MLAPSTKRVTYAEYRTIEAGSDVRCELFDGVVYAMAGGTIPHADVQAGLLGALIGLLRGAPCRPRGSDARVYFPRFDEAAYPDVQVVCGRTEFDPADPDAAINPALIAEVLSPSTEAWDRGGKFRRYESLPSVGEILLVASDAVRIESFTRNPDDSWTRRMYGAGDSLPLRIGGAVAVDEVYALYHAERAAR